MKLFLAALKGPSCPHFTGAKKLWTSSDFNGHPTYTLARALARAPAANSLSPRDKSVRARKRWLSVTERSLYSSYPSTVDAFTSPQISHLNSILRPSAGRKLKIVFANSCRLWFWSVLESSGKAQGYVSCFTHLHKLISVSISASGEVWAVERWCFQRVNMLRFFYSNLAR